MVHSRGRVTVADRRDRRALLCTSSYDESLLPLMGRAIEMRERFPENARGLSN